MENSIKGLAKATVSNIHCPPLSHQASNLTVEDHPVYQAFLLQKSMLTKPKHLLALHVWKWFPGSSAPPSLESR